MEIKFTDSFFKSLKKMNNHQTWWYKTYDVFRYKIPKFLKNIWRFRNELWYYREYDYSGTLQNLRRSLELLGDCIDKRSYEVEESKNKKVQKIKRAIEILDNIKSDVYLEKAELELGLLYQSRFEFVETENGLFNIKSFLSEFQEKHNREVYRLSEKIESEEWNELWQILKGQSTDEFLELNSTKKIVWDDWFDGSGVKHWWK